jgi:hypothetical protein
MGLMPDRGWPQFRLNISLAGNVIRLNFTRLKVRGKLHDDIEVKIVL